MKIIYILGRTRAPGAEQAVPFFFALFSGDNLQKWFTAASIIALYKQLPSAIGINWEDAELAIEREGIYRGEIDADHGEWRFMLVG